jgi:hypothetical protein
MFCPLQAGPPASAPGQGFCALSGKRCNNLTGSVYKQVFAATLRGRQREKRSIESDQEIPPENYEPHGKHIPQQIRKREEREREAGLQDQRGEAREQHCPYPARQ